MPSEYILEMAGEIESLAKLCADLITELEQYKTVDEEEQKFLMQYTSTK